MSDKERQQLEIINENLITLARNQAILYSEISLIKYSLNKLQEVDQVQDNKVRI